MPMPDQVRRAAEMAVITTQWTALEAAVQRQRAAVSVERQATIPVGATTATPEVGAAS
jgi:hypothetical protein